MTHAIWDLISSLKVVGYISELIRIYYDNSTTVFFSKNNNNGSQKKHINIKYFIVKEKVKEYEVLIEHIKALFVFAF
jgi:hypothetical protein